MELESGGHVAPVCAGEGDGVSGFPIIRFPFVVD